MAADDVAKLVAALQAPQMCVDVGPELERHFGRALSDIGPHVLSNVGYIKDALLDAMSRRDDDPVRALAHGLDAAMRRAGERAGVEAVAHLAMYQVCLCITRALGGTARAPRRVVRKLEEIEAVYGLDIESLRSANGLGDEYARGFILLGDAVRPRAARAALAPMRAR